MVGEMAWRFPDLSVQTAKLWYCDDDDIEKRIPRGTTAGTVAHTILGKLMTISYQPNHSLGPDRSFLGRRAGLRALVLVHVSTGTCLLPSLLGILVSLTFI